MHSSHCSTVKKKEVSISEFLFLWQCDRVCPGVIEECEIDGSSSSSSREWWEGRVRAIVTWALPSRFKLYTRISEGLSVSIYCIVT